MMHRLQLRLGVAAAVVAALSCAAGVSSPHASLDHSLGGLRTQFNADIDRTRVLMIVAPT